MTRLVQQSQMCGQFSGWGWDSSTDWQIHINAFLFKWIAIFTFSSSLLPFWCVSKFYDDHFIILHLHDPGWKRSLCVNCSFICIHVYVPVCYYLLRTAGILFYFNMKSSGKRVQVEKKGIIQSIRTFDCNVSCMVTLGIHKMLINNLYF